MSNVSFRHLLKLVCAAMVLFAAPAHAFEPFIVKEIRVEGLQRISPGTVFNYLPVKKGDRIDEGLSNDAIRALFKTGFFKDVVLERENNTLVVFVVERPAIASVKVEGNVDIATDPLMENLKQLGLTEGRVFDRSLLDKVEQELKREYLALGDYSAQVKTTVKPLERNRVAIEISIAEGEAATIRNINIVGNKAFSEKELLDKFQLGVKPPISFFYDSDQYARQKLAADLETLRSFYLDRGYINFDIVSTQVAITPDKQHIYITINITEGEQYKVSEIKVAGDTILPQAEVRKLISMEPGQIFSRRELTDSAQRISERLGEVGYAFANINPIPEVNEAKREVKLTFFVDPGKRVYVRRINITGNQRTNDEVLRRELRQMEGAPLESAKINRSRTRLNRLGYFETINVDTRPVPGSPDLVDVNYDVKERDSFGSFNAGIGYGDVQGFLVNASINEENFLGTGNSYRLNFNNSASATEYSFSFTNPYYTLDGVSRSTNLFYRTTNPGAANQSTGYTLDSYGGNIHFGVPLSEYNTFRYGFEAEHTRVNIDSDAPDHIIDFCREEGGADIGMVLDPITGEPTESIDRTGLKDANCGFNAWKGNVGWSFDTRDRILFPTDGTLQTIGSEVAFPAGPESVSFYKVNYGYRHYTPIDSKGNYVLQLKTDLAYGDGYGETQDLPPFEKYFAGGARTVRGFTGNTLGPKDSQGDPIGGNMRVLGNAELIFRGPVSENNDSVRLGLFVDAGNVFKDVGDVNVPDIRYSTGLTLYWITPIGPLTFSYAVPLNEQRGDETQFFQFSLGTPL